MAQHSRNRIYPFALVESALATIHGIDPDDMVAFRGRTHHLQRLGLIDTAPGRGRKPIYSAEEVYIWAFCFELIQVGMAPAAINRFVLRYWNGILFSFVEWPSRSEEDCLLVFQPRMLDRDFPDRVEPSNTDFFRLLARSELSGEEIAKKMGGRVVVIDVSHLREDLHAILDPAVAALHAEMRQAAKKPAKRAKAAAG